MQYFPIIISAIALVFSVYQFIDKEKRDNTTEITTIIVKLETIGDGINEIKTDLRSVKAEVKELRERLIETEQRAKSNTRRLDAIDGRHDE